MPQIPYTGAPSVGPAFAPTPSVRSNVSAETLGAGVAAESGRLGATLIHAGDELFSRAMAMQQLDQQADAFNAHAAASDAVGKRVMDYRTLSGKSAKDGYEPFVADIDKIIKDSGADLSSPYAKHLYQQETMRLRQYTVDSAGAHAGREFKNYLVGTEQSRSDNAVDTVGLHPEDNAAFDQQIASIKSTTMGTLQGWSPEQTEDYINKETSKAVAVRAHNWALTDPIKAKSFLDKAMSDGLVSGDVAGKLSSFIRTQRNSVMTRVESGALISGEGFHFGSKKVSPQRLYNAIIGVESSGDYSARGSVVKSGPYRGQRALGIGQVMPGNLRPWLAEAGMKPMSEEEYLHDHDAQDQLIKFKLGQLQEKLGSANAAAVAWRGDAEVDPTIGETKTEYLKKFNAHLAKSATSGEVETIASSRARELAPDDDEFHFGFRDASLAIHRRDRAIEREEELSRRQVIDEALVPDRDGKLVSELPPDPKVHDAWNALSATDRLRYQKLMAQNAKGDYAPTQENQAAFQVWYGRLTDPQASEEERMKAVDADYATMPMPAGQRQQLIRLRAKLASNAERNPAVSHAMQALAPMLNEAGVTKKADEEGYYQFLGTLSLVMEQKQKDAGGKPLKDEEIRTIGAGLLREQVTGWWDRVFGGERMFKTEVPEASRVKIVKAYTDEKGFEPSEQTVQTIYAAHLYNEFYGGTVAAKKFGGKKAEK